MLHYIQANRSVYQQKLSFHQSKMTECKNFIARRNLWSSIAQHCPSTNKNIKAACINYFKMLKSLCNLETLFFYLERDKHLEKHALLSVGAQEDRVWTQKWYDALTGCKTGSQRKVSVHLGQGWGEQGDLSFVKWTLATTVILIHNTFG